MTLLEARVQSQMTQAQLANLAGITATAVCLIETGKQNPTRATRLKLETALEMEVDWNATRKADAVRAVMESIERYITGARNGERSECFCLLRRYLTRLERRLQDERLKHITT